MERERQKRKQKGRPVPPDRDAPRPAGLCATCARRDRCDRWRRAEGGIWRCADYEE